MSNGEPRTATNSNIPDADSPTMIGEVAYNLGRRYLMPGADRIEKRGRTSAKPGFVLVYDKTARRIFRGIAKVASKPRNKPGKNQRPSIVMQLVLMREAMADLRREEKARPRIPPQHTRERAAVMGVRRSRKPLILDADE